ncbi:hypothetical protein HNQ81_001399 [Desulfoprunum benzoelyticum]|uniref:Transcriptional regulator, AbiEi antitoxin, Type IV TA system n=1 Tax=Desulfoprunum benzoelyticum TaxID=1506996 RepID=A0A840UPV8_9BACT|nr:hypothetical protein [Desulfoprunum benzoelyticum]MBB5347675.1 hypothetical protein [Desulfoprunum benzoelyticum]
MQKKTNGMIREYKLEQFGAVPFSHGTLMLLLKGYRRPNDKIAEWLRRGDLVPLKRGLYVAGPPWRKGELSLPLVANRLYGPSCVSLDYALFWHGLIPERVYEVTSVCMRRSRVFDNALGRFSYLTAPQSLFPVGMRQEQASERETFLIAGPEKALCDKVLLTRNLRARSRDAMQVFLFEDLRLDEEALVGLDVAVVAQYAESGHKARQLHALMQVLEEAR